MKITPSWNIFLRFQENWAIPIITIKNYNNGDSNNDVLTIRRVKLPTYFNRTSKETSHDRQQDFKKEPDNRAEESAPLNQPEISTKTRVNAL